MKRSFGLWQLAGYAAVTLGGTLLHFFFDLTGGARWAAPFSGINESTWEHMKLLFWPLLLFALIEYRFFSEKADVGCIKLRGMVLGLGLIPILFYTYNGVIGKSPDWVNIAIFFLSAAAAFFYETWLWYNKTLRCRSPKTAWAVMCIIGALFVLFTFVTPRIGMFRDPTNGRYGLDASEVSS